jgi:hypothetical protein
VTRTKRAGADRRGEWRSYNNRIYFKEQQEQERMCMS